MKLDKWRARARAGAVKDGATLCKVFHSEIRKSEGDDSYTCTISTSSPDRDGDTLSVDGWRLENYQKNPVVLYGHNYRGFPIGTAKEVLKAGTGLVARFTFVGTDLNKEAALTKALVDAGVLRAASVGFRPIKWVWNDERGGFDFSEQELLEFSIVPVPANPEALMASKGMADVDVDMGQLFTELMAKALKLSAPDAGAAAAAVVAAEAVTPVMKLLSDESALRDLVRSAVTEAVDVQLRRATGRLD